MVSKGPRFTSEGALVTIKTKSMKNNTSSAVELPIFNVFCGCCDRVFQPAVNSPLWWKSKKRSDKGYLDAYCCTGQECGCRQNEVDMNDGCHVFGYHGDCTDFHYIFVKPTEAIKTFLKLRRHSEVFILGISEKVKQKLMFA